jgi:hypothetical protein
MGKGYLPEYRYCHSCAKKEQFAWKRCTQCKATGVNLEHLLFTELKLPIKSTPRLRKGC